MNWNNHAHSIHPALVVVVFPLKGIFRSDALVALLNDCHVWQNLDLNCFRWLKVVFDSFLKKIQMSVCIFEVVFCVKYLTEWVM